MTRLAAATRVVAAKVVGSVEAKGRALHGATVVWPTGYRARSSGSAAAARTAAALEVPREAGKTVLLIAGGRTCTVVCW